MKARQEQASQVVFVFANYIFYSKSLTYILLHNHLLLLLFSLDFLFEEARPCSPQSLVLPLPLPLSLFHSKIVIITVAEVHCFEQIACLLQVWLTLTLSRFKRFSETGSLPASSSSSVSLLLPTISLCHFLHCFSSINRLPAKRTLLLLITAYRFKVTRRSLSLLYCLSVNKREHTRIL